MVRVLPSLLNPSVNNISSISPASEGSSDFEQEVLKSDRPNALRINALHILLLKASLFIIVYLRYKICKKLLLHIVRKDLQLIWFVSLKTTILIYNLY